MLWLCFGGVSVVFQWWFGVVYDSLGSFLWSFGAALLVFSWCFGSIFLVAITWWFSNIRECFGSILVVFQWCFSHDLVVCW